MAEKPSPQTPNATRSAISSSLPELQWPYIIRLLAIVNLAGVLMATSICALFYLRYNANPLGDADASDMVSSGLMDVLVEENLMDVIVPAFVIADLVSLAIGLWLSLYFSRKISVPIYRIYQMGRSDHQRRSGLPAEVPPRRRFAEPGRGMQQGQRYLLHRSSRTCAGRSRKPICLCPPAWTRSRPRRSAFGPNPPGRLSERVTRQFFAQGFGQHGVARHRRVVLHRPADGAPAGPPGSGAPARG